MIYVLKIHGQDGSLINTHVFTGKKPTADEQREVLKGYDASSYATIETRTYRAEKEEETN